MPTKKTAKKAPAKKAAKKATKKTTKKVVEEVVEEVEVTRGNIPLGIKGGRNDSIYNEFGLRNDVEYFWKEDEFSVDWKKMINSKHYVVNDKWFEERSKEIPKSVEGLTDEQVIIKLSGYRDLAKLRGIIDHQVTVEQSSDYFACVKCSITWEGNHETNFKPVTFEAIANATRNNTDPFMSMFLETIASNRAFCRCVRNFLGIDIVSSDEMSHGKQRQDVEKESAVEKASAATGEENHNDTSPQGALKKLFKNVFGTADLGKLKSFLRKEYSEGRFKAKDGESPEEVKKWSDWADIPVPDSLDIINLVKLHDSET